MVPDEPGGGGAQTDLDGTYQIDGLAAGSYFVQFQGGDVGLVTEFYDGAASWEDATQVAVIAGADTPDIDAALVAGGSISGTVTGPDGPVAGMWDNAMVPGESGGGGAQTGLDGTYEITGLAAGSYIVQFRGGDVGLVTEYYDGAASWEDATPVVVTAGADTPNIDAAMVVGGSISGTVTGPDGPVGGVHVSAWTTFGDPVGGMGEETGANGTYEFAGLATGSYVVEFDGSSVGLVSVYYNGAASWDDATEVAVTAGADTPNINAVLALAVGSISGTVSGPEGPVAG